jgi:hypothetical protein
MACASLQMADRGCRLLAAGQKPCSHDRYSPFVPPAPVPRTKPPSRFEIIRTVMRNPLELWGEPSFRLKWMNTKFFNERTLIANHPGLGPPCAG